MGSPRGEARLLPLIAIVAVASVGGCASQKPDLQQLQKNWAGERTRGLTPPYFDNDIIAVCDPPIGWIAAPLKSSSQHAHQVWVSPSGATAYGIIYFKLPFPVGAALSLNGFLAGMKRSEGEAILISKQDDSNLPGIRFVADGGLYRIRANLLVDGWTGWAVYAGTLRKAAMIEAELDTAIRAREYTKVGRPISSGN